MKIGVNLSIILLTLGCLAVKPRENVGPEVIQQDIRQITRESVALAIIQTSNSTEDALTISTLLINTLEGSIIPLLKSDGQITKAIVEDLLLVVPDEYKGIMAAAYATFNAHYYFPEDAIDLPEPSRGYLLAFFQGMLDGAELVRGTV